MNDDLLWSNKAEALKNEYLRYMTTATLQSSPEQLRRSAEEESA